MGTEKRRGRGEERLGERKIRARASQPGLFDAGIAGDAEQHSGIINR